MNSQILEGGGLEDRGSNCFKGRMDGKVVGGLWESGRQGRNHGVPGVRWGFPGREKKTLFLFSSPLASRENMFVTSFVFFILEESIFVRAEGKERDRGSVTVRLRLTLDLFGCTGGEVSPLFLRTLQLLSTTTTT